MTLNRALWWPTCAEQVATHAPTREQWAAETASGWPPSDGSTASLDDLEGIQIGVSGAAYRPDLPANHHDYDCRVIRRLLFSGQIDLATAREMRAAADRKHYAGLLRCVSVLIGWSGWWARRRAYGRYLGLRAFGTGLYPSPAEAYRFEEAGDVA